MRGEHVFRFFSSKVTQSLHTGMPFNGGPYVSTSQIPNSFSLFLTHFLTPQLFPSSTSFPPLQPSVLLCSSSPHLPLSFSPPSHATIQLCIPWTWARCALRSRPLHLCDVSRRSYDEDASEAPEKTAIKAAGQSSPLPAQHDPKVCGRYHANILFLSKAFRCHRKHSCSCPKMV